MGEHRETSSQQQKSGYLFVTANQTALRFFSYLSMDYKCKYNNPQLQHKVNYRRSSCFPGMALVSGQRQEGGSWQGEQKALPLTVIISR